MEFDDLPKDFDMKTAENMMVIFEGYAKHWSDFLRGEGLSDDLKTFMQDQDVSDRSIVDLIKSTLSESDGIRFVSNSLLDDWKQFKTNLSSHQTESSGSE